MYIYMHIYTHIYIHSMKIYIQTPQYIFATAVDAPQHPAALRVHVYKYSCFEVFGCIWMYTYIHTCTH